MIHSASFRNFKGLRSVDVSLEQFTVFVGPNASGKTSVLAGLFYLSRLSEKQPHELFQNDLGLRAAYTRRGEGELKLQVATTSGSRRFTARPPIISQDDPNYDGILNNDTNWKPMGEFNPDPNREGAWGNVWEIEGARRKMSPAVFLQLEPARLASPSYSNEQEPQLRRDGTCLASVVYRMAGNRPDDFQELQKKLRCIIKSLLRVRFDRVAVPQTYTAGGSPMTWNWGDCFAFDFANAPNVPGQLASDGTLLALAILTVAMAPDRPKLILLDNIENGLHPNAQKELVGILETILSQNPELQILATTHSPYLVDILKPEQVRITTLTEDGSVACAPLTDHPEYPKWKDEMLPGEFWSFIGEKWVNGRKPVASPQ
jgi:predicted ATPase